MKTLYTNEGRELAGDLTRKRSERNYDFDGYVPAGSEQRTRKGGLEGDSAKNPAVYRRFLPSLEELLFMLHRDN